MRPFVFLSLFSLSCFAHEPSDFAWEVHAKLAFPHLAGAGASMIWKKQAEFFFSLNPVRIPFSIQEVSVSLTHYSVGSFFYPWEGNFFLGLLAGCHYVRGEKNGPVEVDFLGKLTPISMLATADTSSIFLTPTAGWRWEIASNLTLRLSLGWLFPISAKTSVDASSEDPFGQVLIDSIKLTDRYKELETQATTQAERATRHSVPFMNIALGLSL